MPAGTGWGAQGAWADRLLQWGVLWSLSSLHREGNSCGQAAPTRLQCHQWHQIPLEKEEGVMVAVFASKHRTTGSSLWQILDPQVLYECRLTVWLLSSSSFQVFCDLGVTFPAISSCSHNPHSGLFKGLKFPRPCSQAVQSCGELPESLHVGKPPEAAGGELVAVPLLAELKSLKAFNRKQNKMLACAGLALQLLQAVSGMGSVVQVLLRGAHWEQERDDLALENCISRAKKGEM